MQQLQRQINDLYKQLLGANRLAADKSSFQHLLLDFLLSKVMRFLGVNSLDRHRVINVTGGLKIHYRLNRADIFTIYEVWIEEEYQLPIEIRHPVIIDIGANIGLTSLWYARHDKNCKFIAVEPSPENTRVLRANLLGNGLQAEIFEAAAGSTDGFAVFDKGPGSTTGRLVDGPESQKNESSNISSSQSAVRVLSMESIMSSLSADELVGLVKIDIEGGEQELLSGNLSWLERVQAIVIEFHPTLIDYQEVVSVLESSGFQRVHIFQTQSPGNNTVEVFVR